MDSSHKENILQSIQDLNIYQRSAFVTEISNILKSQKAQCFDSTLEKALKQFLSEDKLEVYDYENITATPLRFSDGQERQPIPPVIQDIDNMAAFRRSNPHLHTKEQAFAELESKNMKYLKYSRGILVDCLLEMFNRLGLIKMFKLDEVKLQNFIVEVANSYKRVPYHCFTHAFNITHFNYYIIRTTNIREFLEDIDLLALMLGSLGHDIDHPGANNGFFQKTGHHYAQLTNDQAVLENYHSYMLFHILEKEQNSILKDLKSSDYQRFRKAAIEGILGTDMTKHFALCGAFEGVVKKINEGTYSKSNAEDRDVLIKILVHSADISGPTMEFEDFKSWGLRVSQEFHDQFQAEQIHPKCKENPPLPFLEYKSLEGYINSQIGFTNMFCLPLFKSLQNAFPGFSIFYEQIEANIQKYKEEIQLLKDASEKQQ